MNLGFFFNILLLPPPQFLKVTVGNAVSDWKDSLIFFFFLCSLNTAFVYLILS